MLEIISKKKLKHENAGGGGMDDKWESIYYSEILHIWKFC